MGGGKQKDVIVQITERKGVQNAQKAQLCGATGFRKLPLHQLVYHEGVGVREWVTCTLVFRSEGRPQSCKGET